MCSEKHGFSLNVYFCLRDPWVSARLTDIWGCFLFSLYWLTPKVNMRYIHCNPSRLHRAWLVTACAPHRGAPVASCIAPSSAWSVVHLLFNFPPKLRSHPSRTSCPPCLLEYEGWYRQNEAPGCPPTHCLSAARQLSVNHLPNTFQPGAPSPHHSLEKPLQAPARYDKMLQ